MPRESGYEDFVAMLGFVCQPFIERSVMCRFSMIWTFCRTFPSHQIPPQYKGVLQINEKTERYYPHVWFNDFWLLRDYLVLVNESLTEIPIQFSIEPLHPIKFILFVQMEQSFSMQEQWGMSSASEADEVKRIFLEGNPFFLTLTVFVSLLHSVFDVLAFKNDVTFWKDNKSMKGEYLLARIASALAARCIASFIYLGVS